MWLTLFTINDWESAGTTTSMPDGSGDEVC